MAPPTTENHLPGGAASWQGAGTASRVSNTCFDAADPWAQTQWWAQVLDDHRLPPEGEQEWDDEVERILALGATMYGDLRDGDTGWAVLADPEGNEFCVLTRYQPDRPEG